LTSGSVRAEGSLEVRLKVSQQTKTEFLYKYEVLRLTRAGGTSVQFAIAPEARGDSP